MGHPLIEREKSTRGFRPKVGSGRTTARS
jgi:hypothetical protein